MSDNKVYQIGARASGDIAGRDIVHNYVLDDGSYRPPQLSVPTTNTSNYYYFGNQRTKFFGRAADFNKLAIFRDVSEKFSWTILAGSGGIGKSRLALHFCLKELDGWDFGFLEDFRVDQWIPLKNTFIFIDYAGRNVSKVSKLLYSLSLRAKSFDFKVRIVLIERFTEGKWINALFQYGRKKATLETHFYQEVIQLNSFTLEESLSFISEISADPSSLGDQYEELQSLLTNRTDYRTPLILSILAGELQKETSISHLQDGDIIEDFVSRELELYKEKGVNSKELNLAALATIVGGIDIGFLNEKHKSAFNLNLFPTPSEFQPSSFETMNGVFDTDLIKPIEPDLIGEFFVLTHLSKRHKLDRTCSEIRDWAWLLNTEAYYDFLNRASKSFPNHEVVQLFVSENSQIPCQNWSASTAIVKSISELVKSRKLSEAKTLLAILEEDISNGIKSGLANIAVSVSVARHCIVLGHMADGEVEDAIEFAESFIEPNLLATNEFFVTPTTLAPFLNTAGGIAAYLIPCFMKTEAPKAQSIATAEALYELSLCIYIDSWFSIYCQAFHRYDGHTTNEVRKKIHKLLRKYSSLEQLQVLTYHFMTRELIFETVFGSQERQDLVTEYLVHILSNPSQTLIKNPPVSGGYLDHFRALTERFEEPKSNKLEFFIKEFSEILPHIYCIPVIWCLNYDKKSKASDLLGIIKLNEDCTGCRDLEKEVAGILK